MRHTLETHDLFAQHGIRCTRQRVEIYDALAASKAHPTAEELHTLVSAVSPGVSLATVYNALEAFCDADICRKIPMPEGGARFDADLEEHLHLRMPGGEVRDIPLDLGDKLLQSVPADVIADLEQRMGVRIRGVRVELLAEPPDA